jgi:phosphoribosylcarboxyaminoimidazole (NCAIR) mutase
MKPLLAFTRMTGYLVMALIGCGKPIIAAVDGVTELSSAVHYTIDVVRVVTGVPLYSMDGEAAARILALSTAKLKAKIRAGRKAMAGAVEKAASRLR